jgi:hypothetical protein
VGLPAWEGGVRAVLNRGQENATDCLVFLEMTFVHEPVISESHIQGSL